MILQGFGSSLNRLGRRLGLAALLLGALPTAFSVEVPTRIEVLIPAGTNNSVGPGLYVCTGSGGDLSCPSLSGTLTDDAFLQRIDFGSARFDFVEGEIAPGLVSVITSGSGVNAEWGDDDDASDGNDEPFAKSGNPSPPANQETEVPSERDPAVAEALGDTSIVEGIDGEGNDYTLRLDFQAAVLDDDPNSDGSPELLFLERGINSDTQIRLIFQDANGLEQFTNFLIINRSELVSSGIDIDTLEINGAQSLGIIGVDLSDFTGGNFDPAVSPVIGVEFGSAGGGADFFGFFALSRELRRDFGDAPDPAAGTGPGNYRTRAADGGPRHLLPIPPTIYLGTSLPDSDSGNLESIGADADDDGGIADEDGITLGGAPLSGQSLVVGAAPSVTATLNGAGYLNVWIDLNRDGDFDDTVDGQSEQILVDSDQTSASGQRNLPFQVPIPAAAALGDTIVRVRFCGDASDCDTPDGTSFSGEVEDHLVTLTPAPGGAVCYGNFIDGATLPADSAVWSFDDSLVDGSGNGHGPQNTPSVSYTLDDALGNGSAVTLSTGGIQYSDGSFLNDAFDRMSVGFWFRPDDPTPATNQILFDEGGSVNGVAIVLMSAGTVRFEVRENSNSIVVADAPLPADGGWHHVALTYELGEVRAYFDGRLRGNVNTNFGSLASHSSNGGFGEGFGGTASSVAVTPYTGELDEAFTLREATLPGSSLRNYVECVAPVQEDFGDAPDAGLGTGPGDYETILAADGPRHGIIPGLFIGSTAPDADPGVLRNATATADDANGSDDEGGLLIPDMLAVAPNYELDVPVTNTTGIAATLLGWIDFDQSGTFDEDEAATIVVPNGTSNGTVTLDFPTPPDVSSGSTFLRLRLTTDTLVASGGGVDERSLGVASDGEVEDHAFTILDTTFDFGDAPDSFGTLLASDGARHAVLPTLRLGLAIDAEEDAVPGALADGDDSTGSADEDGVRNFPALSASNSSYTISVRVQNQTGSAATLAAWIDFDGNGLFDTDEAVMVPVPDGTNAELPVTFSGLGGAGPDVTAGLTHARLRLTTEAITAADPAGAFADGEVEDYDLVIFGTEQCDIGPGQIIPITTLDFGTPVLESGSPLQLGARYRYSDITAGVDAIVEITDFVNTSLGEIDTTAAANGGFDDAFQPTVNLLSQPGEGYVEFVITLLKANTTEVLEPAPAFLASAIDVDGDSDDAREFVEFYKPFGTVFRENPSLLNITDTGSYFRFLPSSTQTAPGIDPTATENIATLRYGGTAQFVYRAGLVNDDGATAQPRLNSLVFGCINFDNPQQQTIDVDFGDAPAPYPTLLADFPALHTIVPGIGLGPSIDAEIEGQPDVNALGDDNDGTDDEDAVTVGGQRLDGQRFAPGETISIDVATVGTGLLSAWIDWDGNGSWADAGERIANEVAGNGDTITLSVTVPANAAGGTTYARFRYTTDSGISFDGGATDGEVEDYALVIARLDYGDAPDSGPGSSRDDYTTLLSSGGPSHEVPSTPTVYLGVLPPDTDSGLLASLSARGDDEDGLDDEDGVTLNGSPLDDRTLFRGRSADLEVTVNGGGYLNLWLDLNRDGDFADTIGGVPEQVVTDDDFSTNTGALTVTVPVTIPTSAVVGPSYLRVRYCSTPATCDVPVGPAPDGEVEDYRVLLAPVAGDGEVRGLIFEDNGAGGGVAHDGLQNGTERGLGGLELLLLFDEDDDQICDGTEIVLAQTVTDGDGVYSLRPNIADENKPACLLAETSPGFRSISEDGGGNAIAMGSPFDDGATLLTPGPAEVVADVNFGDIRLPRLAPDRQDSVAPGASVSYLHFYDATTDASVDFILGSVTDGPAGLGWDDALYRDADCSGDLSGTEADDTLTNVPVLAGDRICLLVRTFAPANAPPDALHARVLEAASSFTGTGEAATATVTEITTVIAGQLRLTKSVRNIGPDGSLDTPDDVDLDEETFDAGGPGDVLRYRIRFRNEGDLPVRNLVIRDATPDFTSLAEAIACPLSLPGSLTACAVAAPDGVNGAGYRGEIRWIFTGLLDTGAEGTTTFFVRIDE